MRSSVLLCMLVVSVLCVCDARRSFGSSSRRTGNSRPKTPSPPRRPSSPGHSSSSDTFLNAERGGGSSHNHGNQHTPSAPPQPSHTSNQYHPSGSQQQQQQQPNRPIGFEGMNNANKGNTPIGFDNVNSQVQNKPGGNSPPYPAGPPPSYSGGSGSAHEHPPPYPGRPVNAPPAYQPNSPGSSYPNQHNSYPNQQNPYPGQHNSYSNQQNPYHGQQNSYSNQHNPYPNQYNPYTGQHNSYNNQYNPYLGQPNYGGGHGSYPPYQGSFSYPGTTYSGSPFGGGYNGNPHYGPQNFGYGGYPGQYQQPSRSRFGGLPIPIPIPIPIPLGSFGGGGLFGNHRDNHRLLDTFIKSDNAKSTSNDTSVFLLNNSTVTPCTSDHFEYDQAKISVLSCTAEQCAAFKISIHTKTTKETVHTASITVCLTNNLTVTTNGEGRVIPTVSEVFNETSTVCRDVPNNVTITPANMTANSSDTTTSSSVDATTVDGATTDVPTTTEAVSTTTTAPNTTRLCEKVDCWLVEMCLPSVEVVDNCVDCPFRRTGYRSCVKVKMCRSPTVPVSTTATLNNTVSKIDEYNRYNSMHDISNLTLIAYHRPIITFNCTGNTTAPGCPGPQPTTAPLTASSSTQPSTEPCVTSNTQPGELFPAMAGGKTCNTTAPSAVITDSQPAPSKR